ncbi:MAG TPA: hypothetical protein VF808_01245 [Ktedonobacterales bacterium]
MDGEIVADLILRAIAALREHGELAAADTPPLTLTRLDLPGQIVYRSNAGVALSAELSDRANAPFELAAKLAAYLRDVIDTVPAYHDVQAVEAEHNGNLLISLRRS